MEAQGVEYKSGKGFQIVHRCVQCGVKRVNRVAENTIQLDDIEELVSLFRM